MNKKALAVALTAGAVGLMTLTGCTSEADKSAENMGVKAENFEVQPGQVSTCSTTRTLFP